MHISLPTPPAELIRAYQQSAASNPGRYKFRLALMGFLGDVAMTLLRILPFAGPVVVGMLFFPHPYFYVMGGLAILLMVWILRPIYRDRSEMLPREKAPDLFAVLDDLKQRIDVRFPLDVRIDDDFNAGAREQRGLFGLLGASSVLHLGAPLAFILRADELRAVIAHKFGHFSHRHGRFGQWIYQAHGDWLWHAQTTREDDSVLDRAGAVFAQFFVPAFHRRAMVWSRRCEYEADADAAAATSAEALVSGLLRLRAFDNWTRDRLPAHQRQWQMSERDAPADYFERIAAAFASDLHDIIGDVIAEEAAELSAWHDTHPSVTERARALGAEVKLIEGSLPGSSLFGESWNGISARCAAQWRDENAAEWAAAHMELKLLEASLLQTDQEGAARMPLSRQLARARALRRADPDAGLAALRRLASEQPGEQAVQFAFGAALLADDLEDGVEIIKRVATADASYRVAACRRLAAYFVRNRDSENADYWRAQLENFGDQHVRAMDKLAEGVMLGKVPASTRPPEIADCIFAALAAEAHVEKGWLLESSLRIAPHDRKAAGDAPALALVIVVAPFDAAHMAVDAEAIADRQRGVLSGLVEPNAVIAVMPYFSTEPLVDSLQAALDAVPDAMRFDRAAE